MIISITGLGLGLSLWAEDPSSPADIDLQSTEDLEELAANQSPPPADVPPPSLDTALDTTDEAEDLLPPKVAVLPALVTIDGEPRSDLGTSVSDSIIAALIGNQSMVVFDASSRTLQLDPAASEPRPRLAPSQPLAIGKALGVERVYVPVIVSESSDVCLTSKVIGIPSGRVEHVHRHKSRGGVEAIHGVVKAFIDELAPRPKKAPARLRTVRAWISEIPYPSNSRFSPKRKASSAPPADRKAVEQADSEEPGQLSEPHPDERERVGSILQVVAKWNFVVIRNYHWKEIELGDELFFIADEFANRYRKLKVTKLEKRNIIAEITNKHDVPFIRSGEPVFRWREKEEEEAIVTAAIKAPNPGD